MFCVKVERTQPVKTFNKRVIYVDSFMTSLKQFTKRVLSIRLQQNPHITLLDD